MDRAHELRLTIELKRDMRSLQEYVEQGELRRYVRRWYAHLFTDSERHGPSAEWLRTHVTDASPDEISAVFNETYDDQELRPIVLKLLAAIDRFDEQSVARILREHRDEIRVNRCPRCNRIVASPNAKQCLWCGHNWHSSGASQIEPKAS